MSHPLVEKFKKEIASRLASDALPRDYDERRQVVGDLIDASRQAVADAMEPAINAKAASMPHETYEEKKALARWVNAELRHFDLAIKCPTTGKPAFLQIDKGDTAAGRFQIEITQDNGRPKRTLSSVSLPTLELMPVPFGLSRTEHQRSWSR